VPSRKTERCCRWSRSPIPNGSQAGFGAKKNGELLAIAEGHWDVLLTSDRNIKYQQNMTGRNVSIVILCAKSNRMKDLLPLMPAFAKALISIGRGQVVEVGQL
jgi:hypothetical protein